MPTAIIIAAYVVAGDITIATIASVVSQIKHPCKSVCVQVKAEQDSTATK